MLAQPDPVAAFLKLSEAPAQGMPERCPHLFDGRESRAAGAHCRQSSVRSDPAARAGRSIHSLLNRWGLSETRAALQALFEAEPQPEWPVFLLVTAMREPVSLQTRCNLPGEMQLATCRHATGFMYKGISFRSMSKLGRITAPGFVLGAVGRQGCARIRMCMEAIRQGRHGRMKGGNHKFRTGMFCPLNLRLKNPL